MKDEGNRKEGKCVLRRILSLVLPGFFLYISCLVHLSSLSLHALDWVSSYTHAESFLSSCVSCDLSFSFLRSFSGFFSRFLSRSNLSPFLPAAHLFLSLFFLLLLPPASPLLVSFTSFGSLLSHSVETTSFWSADPPAAERPQPFQHQKVIFFLFSAFLPCLQQ